MKPHDAHDAAAVRVVFRVCAYVAHVTCGRQIVHMGPWGGRTYLEMVEIVATAMHHTHSVVPTTVAQVLEPKVWCVARAAPRVRANNPDPPILRRICSYPRGPCRFYIHRIMCNRVCWDTGDAMIRCS